MKNLTRLLPFLLVILLANCKTKPTVSQVDNDLIKQLVAKRIQLPNGWSLTPAGSSLPLGDLPLNLVVSPSGNFLATTNNGQSTQSITLIDAKTEKVLDDVEIRRSWYGLAFSPDEQFLYASGGNDNLIQIYKIVNNKLQKDEVISLGAPWPNKIGPAGIAIDGKKNRLYVVTKEDKSLYVCDLGTRKVIRKVPLPAEAFSCMLSSSGTNLFVSIWGGERVLILDAETQALKSEIPTDSHPSDMVLTKDGKYLYVANANVNTVSVIHVPLQRVVETLTTSLFPDAPAGSTPNGLCLSPDEKTLYIANADNNCVAVFDVATPNASRSLGFVPTGWYPTSVKTIGNRLFVANGKGFSSFPNPKGPNPMKKKQVQEKGPNPASIEKEQYIGGLFKGTLSIIDLPDANTLSAYSQVVYQNSPYSKQKEQVAEGEAGNPIPRKVGESSPIKYVFYIIKENRTYDQVLGDMKEGNGDPSLCIFPEKTTPNQHKLAREFVLLDNFYVDAEVSADGHNWSMAAYANDFVEKSWPTSYGGRGGTYDYEGSRPIAYPKLGFIWDHCKRAGVSYRTYGEFISDNKATMSVLEGHFCKTYHGWDMSYKDIDREASWEKDLDSLIGANAVPRFNSLRFGNDHTSGAALNKATPEAAVADNDLAVGRFVEYLSKSSIWKESVVFILEDDAQNGSDHVDAHRSIAFVAGPHVKRGFVDHTMYSTSGMLRTIELILGIPPMSQYDAAATPMWRSFSNKPDFKAFTSAPANIDLDWKNTAYNRNAKRCAEFDLAREDAIPDIEFNQIIWQTVKGLNTKMPPPRRGAFVLLAKREDDDDEEDEDDD